MNFFRKKNILRKNQGFFLENFFLIFFFFLTKKMIFSEKSAFFYENLSLLRETHFSLKNTFFPQKLHLKFSNIRFFFSLPGINFCTWRRIKFSWDVFCLWRRMKNNLVVSKVNTFNFICHVFVRRVLWLVLVCRLPLDSPVSFILFISLRSRAVAAGSGRRQSHVVFRRSWISVHLAGHQSAGRVHHTCGAEPSWETQRHEQSLLEARTWSHSQSLDGLRYQEHHPHICSLLLSAVRWWIALMRSQETQTAEWWWFLEQGSSSQLVGVWLFTRFKVFVGKFLFTLCCVSVPGIDLMDMASDVLQPEGDDMARTSWNMRRIIAKYQDTFSVIEKVGPESVHHSNKDGSWILLRTYRWFLFSP